MTLRALSDDALLTEVKALAGSERRATAHLIAALMELDARRLYLGQGYSSLFTYCTQALHLSESAAYRRIEAARCAKRFPVVLSMLVDGSINLTTVTLLAKLLTPENHCEVLASVHYASKSAVERLVATLQPTPSVPSAIRKLPTKEATPVHVPPSADASPSRPLPTPKPPSSAPRPTTLVPLAPEIYKIQFTMTRESHDTLRKAQALLRHAIPSGDPALVIDRALTLLVAQLERNKCGATSRPKKTTRASSHTRYVSPAVRREVWARDGGQCKFEGAGGRCQERGFLEYHHVTPFADGGATTASNLELRCRAHNAYEATQADLYVRERSPVWFTSASGSGGRQLDTSNGGAHLF